MCRLYRLLYTLFPVKRFRSLLIEKHFSVCSNCQKETEIESQLRDMLADPDWIAKEVSMWPQIREKLYSQRKKSFKAEKTLETFFFKKWKWAAVGLILVVATGLILMVQINYQRKSPEAEVFVKETPRVLIKHVEIEGKKARAYIYQTPEISFIWFSEIKNNGG
ncbi:MAG: hypothetical protein OEY25_14080 [Candidatus Aminicenantes bacterium]|nr:hypothetical protein [Candidatus Aminicenantes bacterium]MDH5706045.1 hypothetical protein [Candidatus Aminicenantes bacterium]